VGNGSMKTARFLQELQVFRAFKTFEKPPETEEN
jgi:hypothetical protein